MQILSMSARDTTHGPFQPTNRAVWKMKGARRWRILAVVGWHAHWWRIAPYNGDFSMAIAHMHADRDGNARLTA